MPPNRRPRRSPGALPLASERDLYISLMRQGVRHLTRSVTELPPPAAAC